ncbi:tryptophan halogenase family protein [Bowmanella yangjiangensis]|uniref:Tryptophan 7-halogenase n=1 Tax=Bowmanella yangjiangensis TaxID=2811230 RepID=A0ABS3CT72_9ALTE|nr:tryptophan halogenase family protein [Bowmanella yangjiangensis]MBN7820311.1 tryptophan 7-halogenase [Bowmanella yangjiangensis]
MLNSKPRKILIVGGGTAGWMAANLLAAKWQDVDICLVESKDIGIIGVGEGSTPHLKLFFDAINVSDQQWMPQCNATYKNGITFDKWSSIAGFESYFHPFAAQIDDVFTLPLFFKHIQARMQGYAVDAHPDKYFLETYLTRQHLGPLPAESFPFGMAYGYHFDSALLGQFLADQAQRSGVTRIEGHVTDVELNQQGHISAVKLSDGMSLAADFFIDCSGFNALLLQQGLGVNFTSYKQNLFNDAAVVMPSAIAERLPVETRSTALTNGWAWKIPLSNRFGNGYVYSRDYIDADQAETELRQHLGLLDADVEARHLRMKVGRVEKHWHKNCLAVGLSQGFIEPLEATAIALSFNTIAQFMQYFQQGHFSNQFEDEFNKDINARFDGIRDYIVCHYKANQRQDSDYWRDNASNTHLSDNLNNILHLWQHSHDFVGDMYKHNLMGSYQPKSWACMLAGYGVFPPLRPDKSVDKAIIRREMDALNDFIRRCGLNFQDHHALLAKLAD